jgi:hypothetical protein
MTRHFWLNSSRILITLICLLAASLLVGRVSVGPEPGSECRDREEGKRAANCISYS